MSAGRGGDGSAYPYELAGCRRGMTASGDVIYDRDTLYPGHFTLIFVLMANSLFGSTPLMLRVEEVSAVKYEMMCMLVY